MTGHGARTWSWWRGSLAVAGFGVFAIVVRTVAIPWLQQRALNLGVVGTGSPRVPASPFVWCDIERDGTVSLHLPKIELGQGVHTALAQVFADALGADWDTIAVVQAGAERGFAPGLVGAGGSTSVASLYGPLRAAGAAVADAMRMEAARRLGVAPSDVTVAAGRCVLRSDPDRGLAFAEVFESAKRAWTGAIPAPPPAPPVLVGRPLPRVDGPDKVTGRAVFGADVRLPNMLHGVVARPPRPGARLRRVTGVELARGLPGVSAVIVERGFVGVAAERRSQAVAALATLELEWRGGVRLGSADIERLVSAPAVESRLRPGGPVQRDGHARRILDRTPPDQVLCAEYRTAMVRPLPFEAPVAVADVQRDWITVHVPSQVPLIRTLQVALALRRWPGSVTVAVPYVGGSFGRKIAEPVAVEAARLSRAVGRPVRVAWTMSEEIQYGRFRAPTHHRLRATLNDAGQIAAFEHRLAGGGTNRTVPLFGRLSQLTRMDVSDIGGSENPYTRIPQRSVTYHLRGLPWALPIGGFRSYGMPVNCFAAESFMDEIAVTAGMDPLAFRLAHLGADPLGRRLAAVLAAAATAAGWETPPAGRARGIATGRTPTLAGGGAAGVTVTALVAEVEVVHGRITVRRLWCAVDAGLIVNPSGARAQVEGSLLMGLGWALTEKVQLVDGMAPSGSLADYAVPRLSETPEIEVLFLGSDAAAPSGLGEPATAPVAAAVANAVFALTGQRLRSLPLQRDGASE